MLSLFSAGVHAPERLIPVERIRNLLRQPGGVTMTFMVESLRAPRDIISNDLETMRDYLGFPVRWDPGTGTYRLDPTHDAGRPPSEGCDLALLYRAIALEEYLYVTFMTGSGDTVRLHAMPGKVENAPFFAVQRFEDDRCPFLDAVGHVVAFVGQRSGHAARFVAGPRQVGEILRAAE